MVVKTYSNRQAGFFIVSEANRTRSRATIVVQQGQVLEAGAVLALNAATGRYAAYDNDGTAPRSAARAILFAAVDATDGPKEAVALVRDCEVHGDEIVFAGSEDTGDKEAAYADLATHGIIVRFEERVT
jgi:head decoration protein D